MGAGSSTGTASQSRRGCAAQESHPRARTTGPRSVTQFALPDLPDSLELALDAAAGQAQTLGNVFILMAFELALGNCAQAIVVEHAHQTLILFHCNRQHFRRRGVA